MLDKNIKEKETEQIKKAISDKLPLRVDKIQVFIVNDWAFCDVLEIESGSVTASMGVIAHKEEDVWKLAVKGRPLDEEWDNLINTLPSDVRREYEDWRINHF
jgi:hypothetical protein